MHRFKRDLKTIALLSALLLGVVCQDMTKPGVAHAAPSPSQPSISRYMATVDATTMYNLGQQHGNTPDLGVIILDFGQPWEQNGYYGSALFDSGATFATMDEIEFATKNFIQGYFDNRTGSPFVKVGIGTSNSGSKVTSTHGHEWAQMVQNILDWVNQPPSYAGVIVARGAIDIEMDFNTSSVTIPWAENYDSTTTIAYYNYGDCGGCPISSTIKNRPGYTVNNGWTQQDIYHVSWNLDTAVPLPEIYREDAYNAKQWQKLALYATLKHNNLILFKGSMTQYQACTDHNNVGCATLKNSRTQGYQQLWDRLNSDSRTAQSPDAATDLTYQN